jgi:hypothetical protein
MRGLINDEQPPVHLECAASGIIAAHSFLESRLSSFNPGHPYFMLKRLLSQKVEVKPPQLIKTSF